MSDKTSLSTLLEMTCVVDAASYQPWHPTVDQFRIVVNNTHRILASSLAVINCATVIPTAAWEPASVKITNLVKQSAVRTSSV